MAARPVLHGDNGASLKATTVLAIAGRLNVSNTVVVTAPCSVRCVSTQLPR